MKALIIVDIQKDFLPGGALAVPGGDEIVAVANNLISQGGYNRIVATQDWHPANHVSFAENHKGREVEPLSDARERARRNTGDFRGRDRYQVSMEPRLKACRDDLIAKTCG